MAKHTPGTVETNKEPSRLPRRGMIGSSSKGWARRVYVNLLSGSSPTKNAIIGAEEWHVSTCLLHHSIVQL